jgi:hypothetical protein
MPSNVLVGRGGAPYIVRVIHASLTLQPREFPFPALASYAAVAPLGREREIAMACLLCARLIDGTLPPLNLSLEVRRARATGALAWLASHPMSARLRAGFERLIDATASDEPAAIARALRLVLEMTGPRLDEASRSELQSLLARIG